MPIDETGGFIHCKCGEMKFLPMKAMKMFKIFKKNKINFVIK